ncbi:unnamed protein product [Strongylus vulgaris]|uniref:Tudor domain-containing protein n=1 Tax=Strongylus vulgaris TaxID=40348 RepID=A0A3P7IW00_STRVU|nr:unnamed protein product [Strongylus vulgaris]
METRRRRKADLLQIEEVIEEADLVLKVTDNGKESLKAPIFGSRIEAVSDLPRSVMNDNLRNNKKSKESSMLNKGQRREPMRGQNARGNQGSYSQTPIQNMNFIPNGTLQAFSNMRISNTSRNPLPDVSYPPPPPQHRFSKNHVVLPQWKVGDQCKAPWTDGSYYLATIVNLGPAGMCAVRYNEYGDIMTVPQAVLLLEAGF